MMNMDSSNQSKLPDMEASFSRRRFVEITGLGMLGLASAYVLDGCSAQEGAGAESLETESSDPKENSSIYPLTIAQWDGDSNQFEQTYPSAPGSAIALTDSTAEIMCRIGLAGKLIGAVDPEAEVPEDIAAEYESTPKLGGKKTLSRETIVGMSPEIVLGRAIAFTESAQTDAEAFNDLGISVYVQIATASNGNPTLQKKRGGVIEDVENIAKIFDAKDGAQPLVDEMTARLKEIEDRVNQSNESSDPKSVLIMTNFINGTYDTFGGSTGASLQFDIVDQLGGIMASTGSASGLTYENLVVSNPDVIAYITADRNKETDPLVLETLYSEPSIQSVPAIANKSIVLIPYAEFMEKTPRIFNSVESLLGTMYPAES